MLNPKNLAEADGSRDNLPPPADAPEQFGLELNVRHQSTINMIDKILKKGNK